MRNSVYRKMIDSIIVCMLIISVVVTCGCMKRKRTELEKLTVKRIGPMCPLLEEYMEAHLAYPDSWDELLRWKGLEMPINPYTGEKMVALESKEFDPEVSPGNIYYMRVIEYGQVVNCQVIIFGERGEITRYNHTYGFGAK